MALYNNPYQYSFGVPGQVNYPSPKGIGLVTAQS